MGAKVVVIGGGTGSHTVLTGLKRMDCDLTAVVNMSDDGGSSGRLRDELGQLPPGDVRQCLAALANDDSAADQLRRLFNYRFTAGNGLNGHSFGNLFLSALTEIMGGADAAIEEASRMLRIRGRVLPVTLNSSALRAELADGTVIKGESSIDIRTERVHVPIRRVYLSPPAYAHPPVLDAIDEAEAIVIGPGDIYTSLLPNFLVEGVAEAVNRSGAVKIYVCNLMTKPGESDGFRASHFLEALARHLDNPSPVDFLLVNNAGLPDEVRTRYRRCGQHPVELDEARCRAMGASIVEAPLLSAGVYLRHDPHALARAIMGIVMGIMASAEMPVEAQAGAGAREPSYVACCLPS